MENNDNCELIVETPDGKLCPVRTVQKIIEGKWKFIILFYLSKKTIRFNELQRLIPNISHGVLTIQLRELEKADLIHREIYNEIPPRVEYSLSETGKNFLPILDSLIGFGKEYIKNHDVQFIKTP